MGEPVRTDLDARRPIAARNTTWAHQLARRATAAGVSPNSVSVASIAFAALAGLSLWLSAGAARWTAVALLATTPVWIGLRALCNLLDGMIAVEGGRATRSGVIFNEFPDRVSDIAMFIGAGYAARFLPYGVELGWAAATAAVLVAYTRALGASANAGHDFRGPAAKAQRMAILALGCWAAAIERALTDGAWAILVTLIVICAGSFVTIWRRLRRTIATLENPA